VGAGLDVSVHGVRSCSNLREVCSGETGSRDLVSRQLLDSPRGAPELFLVSQTIGPVIAPIAVPVKSLRTPRPLIST